MLLISHMRERQGWSGTCTIGSAVQSLRLQNGTEDIVSENTRNLTVSAKRMRGFSMIELVIAMLVMLIVAAIAIPTFMNAMHGARLKGVITDFAGLMQSGRIRAVDDDRYYSLYVFGNNPPEGFVDIYPQNQNGTSGSNGTVIDPRDPVIQISAEIIQQPQAAAPSTASLKLLFLPANTPVPLQDGSSAATPITFGPRGLPCQVNAGVCNSVGSRAYWTFFQNNVTQGWGAVTVTPAGRIQRWIFTGGPAGVWARY